MPTKKPKSLKITTYKSLYSNKAKYAHSSVYSVNHRYSNAQNCIIFICKCDTTKKKMRGANVCRPPPPPSRNHKTVYTALI